MSAPTVYEGQVYIRPADRGIVLDDLEGAPHLDEWLAKALGEDSYWGRPGAIRVRITVERLDEAVPAAVREGTR